MKTKDTWTVVDAAYILEEKGLATAKSSEQTIRRWIRSYAKEYESQMVKMEHSDISQEEKERLAHEEARKKGLRANKVSKKKGYIIDGLDFVEFVERKMKGKLKKVYESGSFRKYEYDEEKYRMREVKAKRWDELGDYTNRRDYEAGFDAGFKAALEFLEEKNKENYKLPKEIEKELIELPNKYRWYQDIQDVDILNIQDKTEESEETLNVRVYGLSIRFSYRSLPNVTFVLRIFSEKNYAFSKFYSNFKAEYMMAAHTKKHLDELFHFHYSKYESKKLNLKALKNVLLLVERTQSGLKEIENGEDRFLLLDTCNSIIDNLEQLLAGENKSDS